MLIKEKPRRIFFLIFFMFFLSLTLFGGSGISLAINGIAPFLVLSLLVPFSGFTSVTRSALVGFLCGAVVDSISADSGCYNTVALFVIGVLANLLSQSVFNRNLKAVITLCLLLTCGYYLFYWLFFMVFSLTASDNLRYLLQLALPSSVYTSVLSVPFYLIFRGINKKYE